MNKWKEYKKFSELCSEEGLETPNYNRDKLVAILRVANLGDKRTVFLLQDKEDVVWVVDLYKGEDPLWEVMTAKDYLLYMSPNWHAIC